MAPELTNLLPSEYRKALRREYFLRLATLSVLALACVIVANGFLLIPSYVYVRQQVAVEMANLHSIAAMNTTSEEKQVSARVATLAQLASHLATLSSTPKASASINAVLAVPRSGITLSNITFNAPAQNTPGTMHLSGVATTREALQSYDAALSALPFVTNADLPISDYAQATKIPFTITLTGSFATP